MFTLKASHYVLVVFTTCSLSAFETFLWY